MEDDLCHWFLKTVLVSTVLWCKITVRFKTTIATYGDMDRPILEKMNVNEPTNPRTPHVIVECVSSEAKHKATFDVRCSVVFRDVDPSPMD